MTDKNMDEKLLKIIQNYGTRKQLKKISEELYEFQEAVIEREIHWDYDTEIQDIKPLEKHIVEEMADCFVLLMQFKEYYHMDGNEIMKIMTQKIDRQLDRINNSKGE